MKWTGKEAAEAFLSLPREERKRRIRAALDAVDPKRNTMSERVSFFSGVLVSDADPVPSAESSGSCVLAFHARSYSGHELRVGVPVNAAFPVDSAEARVA